MKLFLAVGDGVEITRGKLKGKIGIVRWQLFPQYLVMLRLSNRQNDYGLAWVWFWQVREIEKEFTYK